MGKGIERDGTADRIVPRHVQLTTDRGLHIIHVRNPSSKTSHEHDLRIHRRRAPETHTRAIKRSTKPTPPKHYIIKKSTPTRTVAGGPVTGCGVVGGELGTTTGCAGVGVGVAMGRSVSVGAGAGVAVTGWVVVTGGGEDIGGVEGGAGAGWLVAGGLVAGGGVAGCGVGVGRVLGGCVTVGEVNGDGVMGVGVATGARGGAVGVGEGATGGGNDGVGTGGIVSTGEGEGCETGVGVIATGGDDGLGTGDIVTGRVEGDKTGWGELTGVEVGGGSATGEIDTSGGVAGATDTTGDDEGLETGDGDVTPTGIRMGGVGTVTGVCAYTSKSARTDNFKQAGVASSAADSLLTQAPTTNNTASA